MARGILAKGEAGKPNSAGAECNGELLYLALQTYLI